MITALIATRAEWCALVGQRAAVRFVVSTLNQRYSVACSENRLCSHLVRFHHHESGNRQLIGRTIFRQEGAQFPAGNKTLAPAALPARYIHVCTSEKSEHREPLIRNSSAKVTVRNESNVVQHVQASAEPSGTRWTRIKEAAKREALHYWRGSKLLWGDFKISNSLCVRSMKGDYLTRRERRQLSRTRADLWKLVPFSVLVALPMSMVSIPILLKFFPNMLPSTFSEEANELKSRLHIRRVKMQMAALLQQSVERNASISKMLDQQNNCTLLDYAALMQRIRSTGKLPTLSEVSKYSKLLDTELSFEKFNEAELKACCTVLELSTLGPAMLLRRRLRSHLRLIQADDVLLLQEGIEHLTIWELRAACRKRGMRSLDVSSERLVRQLRDWLKLCSSNVSISLLLLSRPMYIPEVLQPEDKLSESLSLLPKIESVQALVLAQREQTQPTDLKVSPKVDKAELNDKTTKELKRTD